MVCGLNRKLVDDAEHYDVCHLLNLHRNSDELDNLAAVAACTDEKRCTSTDF